MLAAASRHFAEKLGNSLRSDREQVEVFAYGTQIILEAWIQVIVIIIASLLLNVFPTTMVFLVSYALVRRVGGGPHLSTYLQCCLAGLVMAVGMGKLATVNTGTSFVAILAAITITLAVYTTVRYVPAGTKKRTIGNPLLRRRQKIKMAVLLVIWMLVTLILVINQQLSLARACIYSLLTVSFFTTPAGYRVMAVIDRYSSRREG